MKVALAGNPNSGKTSIFNHLTGLNQRVGNYPGITVDKKFGSLAGHKEIQIIDLPGTYSLYPKSKDEEVVTEVLGNKNHPDHPDLIVVVADITNLERNLLLYTQIHDLKIPCLLVLNMVDLAQKKGLNVNINKVKELFNATEVISINARDHSEVLKIKDWIISEDSQNQSEFLPFIENEFDQWSGESPTNEDQEAQAQKRYKKIRQALRFCIDKNENIKYGFKSFDKLATHPVFGYLIFIGFLFLIFQAIYAWSELPMNLIDEVFITLSQLAKNNLPPGLFTDLLAEGIIPGLGGVVIFIPQITLLFSFIFLMEESGYMARVVFIMDKLMRPFGLNGRSVVPLISGIACAIPAIMATRTIDHWKERLITIMVAPLMSCSARLPVYTLLITLVIPDQQVGIFNLKGIALLVLYLLGIIMALIVSSLFKLFVKSSQNSFLIMELPSYKMPRWNNLLITIWEKTLLFVLEAGKIIMAISVLLWVLASYGPPGRIDQAINSIPENEKSDEEAYEQLVASVSLENSYIGILGHAIEPAIRPLGYNWQIGISLLTSFAAREVFVGSMATIYSVGEDFEEDTSLIDRMKAEINPNTGNPVYTLATGISLMLFYAFAMQCVSTLAIVKRETKSWKWPAIQMTYLTALAYFSALLAYQLIK